MIWILIVSLLFFPSLASGQVIINEIAWMGSPTEGVESKDYWRYEWVELFNDSTDATSLDNWAVELYRDELDFKISLMGTIQGGGYFLIASSDKTPLADVVYSNLAGKFNNSGQLVALKDSKGVIIDQVDPVRSLASNGVDAKASWLAGNNEDKKSMERTSSGEWKTSLEVGGTPRKENSKEILKEHKTKKDPIESSSVSLFDKPILEAVALSLGLALAAGFVRRRLLSRV